MSSTLLSIWRTQPDTRKTLLDVGAGLSPYRTVCEDAGFEYLSHDFSSYVPGYDFPGLQNPNWDYPKHNYECDILDIPTDQQFDVILCTEVFEHIPDPVRAFQVLFNLVKAGGRVIVTVPFLSLVHQSPYWYQSGLSPFWFEYWSGKLGFEETKVTVYGDYEDMMIQEVRRSASSISRVRALLLKLAISPLEHLREQLPPDVLSSGPSGPCLLVVSHNDFSA